MQVGQLESDKARLMDRLEEATGEPLGHLLTPIDLLPSDLLVTVPDGNGTRKIDEMLDEKKALSSIVRMAGGGPSRVADEVARSRRGYTASPQEAMAAVRKLRAEREALRKRLFELMPQLTNASKYGDARRELARIGHAIATMEQFVGGMNPELTSGTLPSPLAGSRRVHNISV